MWTLIWALIIAAATVVAALFGADTPRDFWDGRESWFLTAIALLAISAVRPLVSDFLGRRSVQEEQRLLDALKAAHVQVVEITGIDWKDLGLHAFVVKRGIPWFWQEQLVRVARWRLKSFPPAVGVRWTRGKGLIGRCWDLRQNVGADLAKDWGEEALSRDQWEELDEELKYGLAFEEYERLRIYGAIVATPILGSGGRFLGCISADAPAGTFDLLWDDSVLETLHDAALWTKSSVKKLSRA